MLSIIIPTKNEAQYLPILLQSIKRQTFTNYEVIVADNHSEDSTAHIAREWGARVVEGGDIPALGRNRGARAAQGEWLFFMDADTELVGENFLASMTEFAAAGQLQIASPWFFACGNRWHRAYFWGWAWMAYVLQFLAPTVGSNTCILIARRVHEELGGFDERVHFGEDMDYLKRAIRKGQFRINRRAKVEVSSRRLKKEGMLPMLLKAARFNLYYLLHGQPALGDRFNYDFAAYQDKQK